MRSSVTRSRHQTAIPSPSVSNSILASAVGVRSCRSPSDKSPPSSGRRRESSAPEAARRGCPARGRRCSRSGTAPARPRQMVPRALPPTPARAVRPAAGAAGGRPSGGGACEQWQHRAASSAASAWAGRRDSEGWSMALAIGLPEESARIAGRRNRFRRCPQPASSSSSGAITPSATLLAAAHGERVVSARRSKGFRPASRP